MRPLRWICLPAFCVALAQAASAACAISRVAELQISDAGNRPFVDGLINGQPVKMLIDTGSTLTFISEPEAKRLGLKLESVTGMRIFGVGGEKRVSAAQLKLLRIDNFAWKDVRVAVIGRNMPRRAGGLQFVLGEDLLSKFGTEFDFAHGVIRLWRSEGCRPEQLLYWAKSYSVAELEHLDLDNPAIETTVILNGKKVSARLDTGAPRSWATRETAELAGVTETSEGSAPAGSLTGSNGRPIKTWVGTFASFSIGDDETVQNVKLRVGDLFGGDTQEEAGPHMPRAVERFPGLLIGSDFFLAHRVLALYKERKLLFTYNGGRIFQVLAPAPPPAD